MNTTTVNYNTLTSSLLTETHTYLVTTYTLKAKSPNLNTQTHLFTPFSAVYFTLKAKSPNLDTQTHLFTPFCAIYFTLTTFTLSTVYAVTKLLTDLHPNGALLVLHPNQYLSHPSCKYTR